MATRRPGRGEQGVGMGGQGLQDDAILHAVVRTSVGITLDMPRHEEDDAGQQEPAQTLSRARQTHGHHGTHVSKACK